MEDKFQLFINSNEFIICNLSLIKYTYTYINQILTSRAKTIVETIIPKIPIVNQIIICLKAFLIPK